MKAIVDSVEEALKALGQRPVAVEGYRGSEWVLVDYFDFVVHVFTPESREFYALERLWGSAIRVEVADEPVAAWAAAARPDPAPAVWPAARRCLDAALILLFAPPCATCDRPLDHPSASAACAACWTGVARWTPPWCTCCGQPLSPWRPAADVCPRCRRISGAAACVRVVGPYEETPAHVLHAFKYDGRRLLAPALAGLLRAQAADSWPPPTSWCRCRCTGPGAGPAASTRRTIRRRGSVRR